MTIPTPTSQTAPRLDADEPPRRDLWPGIAGIASGVLLLVALLVTYSNFPDYEGEDGLRETVTFYRDQGNLDLTEAMTPVMLVAGLLFFWFLAALARLAGKRSFLVLAGGTAFVVLLMIAAITGAIYAISANNTESFLVGPETAMVAMLLLDVSYGGSIAAMAAAAVLLFAVWRTAVTTHTLPAWLGWFAFVIAVLSLAGPFSAWLTVPLMGLWTVVAGVVLVTRSSSSAAGGS
ncbi:hypothetical protein [Streptomyces adelaidensis]|uniref:hypothetical protein n=1 Tax=Streptomyces adelaidensis TaxID=2796465 RepID=UPI0019074C88|nr:hypothetical protein [Streptomyces adelaidensis]